MSTITIGNTSKGKRVWIQALDNHGFHEGMQYRTTYTDNHIIIQFDEQGKRKVAKGKGGIIDLVGKKVSVWAGSATEARVDFGSSAIIIERQGVEDNE